LLVLKARPRLDNKEVGHRWPLKANHCSYDQQADFGAYFLVEFMGIEVAAVADLGSKSHNKLPPEAWKVEWHGTVDEGRPVDGLEIVAA